MIIFALDISEFVCLFGFWTSFSTTRLYLGRAPRQSVWQFYMLPHMRQSDETMTSVSAGHIILAPTQAVGSRRLQRELNPGPPNQKLCALLTELPRPPYLCRMKVPTISNETWWLVIYFFYFQLWFVTLHYREKKNPNQLTKLPFN